MQRYTSNRGEEEEDAQMRSCGEAVESRSHKVAECKIYKEERGVVGEIWKIDKCDMEKFGTLDSREKMIASR